MEPTKKTVQIYTTPTCHFCQMSKEYFKAHGVDYAEYNVAADMEKRQEMIDKSGQMGVPVIFIDNEMIIGFDKKKFDAHFEPAAETPAAA